MATVLANTKPLIAAVLAYVVLDERLGPRHKAGLALGFIGILLVAIPGFGDGLINASPAGIGYVLLAALGVAIGNVLLKRLAGEVNLLMAVGLQFLFGAMPLFITSQVLEAPYEIAWGGAFWITMLTLALPGTALAFALWFFLLHRNSLTRLNTFTFLTPVLAIFISALAFSESLRGLG